MSEALYKAAPSPPLRRIVIVGGGSAGWMAAAALSRAVPGDTRLELIETNPGQDSGILTPFDSTLPSLRAFNHSLGLNEDALIAATGATIKLGTQFSQWTRKGVSYVHPFSDFGAVMEGVAFHHCWLKLRQAGQVEPLESFALAAVAANLGRFDRPSDDPRSVTSTMSYGLHLNAEAYTAVLRSIAERAGVQGVSGSLAAVITDAERTRVTGVTLSDGRLVEGDLFIDCTGTAASVISALGSTWESWSEHLPCNRVRWSLDPAQAVPCLLTEIEAQRAGWLQTVPLRTATGVAVFDAVAPGEPAPQGGNERLFENGRRTPWIGNCIAIGLSATCLEPLEGTGLHLLQSAVTKLLALFPTPGGMAVSAREYNRLIQAEAERLRDFLIAHYKLNRRSGQSFWDARAAAEPPAELAWKLLQFESRGRIPMGDEETFEEASWLAVFMGQHLQPRRYHPLADKFSLVDTRDRLDRTRAVMRQAAEAMPTHRDYLASRAPTRHSLL